MPGEASRSPVLERLEAVVGEWVTHATVSGRHRASRFDHRWSFRPVATVSGGLCWLLELCPGVAWGDVRAVDEHDRVPVMEVLYGAVDGVVVECCPPEGLADSAVTRDSGARPSSPYVRITMRSTSAKEPSRTVGIAGEAAGGEAADAQMAPVHLARSDGALVRMGAANAYG